MLRKRRTNLALVARKAVFRIDLQVPAEVGHDEQHVAQLRLLLGQRRTAGDRLLQLGDLLVQLGQDRPGMARRSRRGRRAWGASPRGSGPAARPARRPAGWSPPALAARSPALSSSQTVLLGAAADLRVAEHMRVAADHLVVDGAAATSSKAKAPCFLGHARMEDHLQQQVAQLLLQVGEVAALDGVGDLVGFLDRVGGDGGEGLLQVPRAAGLADRAGAP